MFESESPDRTSVEHAQQHDVVPGNYQGEDKYEEFGLQNLEINDSQMNGRPHSMMRSEHDSSSRMQ